MKRIIMPALVALMLVGCHVPPSLHSAPTTPPGRAKILQSQQIGKAHICAGMTKQEVLDQIALANESNTPVSVNRDSEIWHLTCPAPNSQLLGGGAGKMFQLIFKGDRLTEIKQMPWLGA